MLQILFIVLLSGMAIFLILLVLIQRGRGGGLSGAFGGTGGQSAFGAKAGDTFTKITMWTAFIWIVLCTVAALVIPKQGNDQLEGLGGDAAATSTDGAATDGAATGGMGAEPRVDVGTSDPPDADDDRPVTTGPPGTLGSDGRLETPVTGDGAN